MKPVEWCGTAVVPVFPHLFLRRLVGRPICRFDRSRARVAVRLALPLALEEYRVRNLPFLRAVILVPRRPHHEYIGTPIPALGLEAMLRRRVLLSPVRKWLPSRGRDAGDQRVFDFVTSRGIDRYTLSPAGLVDCGHVDTDMTDPLRDVHAALPTSMRRIPLRARYRHPLRLHPTDIAALALAAAALGVLLWPRARASEGTSVDGETPVERPSAQYREAGFAEVLRSVHETLPGAVLETLERRDARFRLVFSVSGTASVGDTFDELKGISAVRITRAEEETKVEIEGSVR